MSEEWIEWRGGDCPDGVAGKNLEIRLRDGREDTDFPNDYYLSRFPNLWHHVNAPRDIVAYRIMPDEE